MGGAINIALQDVCPGRSVTHFGFLDDSVAYQLVVDALSHSDTADPARLPFGKCVGVHLPGVSAVDAAAATDVVVANFNASMTSAVKVSAELPLRSYALWRHGHPGTTTGPFPSAARSDPASTGR
ncbi:hypothetical protein GCM10009759_76490 [Kitasatospora saccharophila]|uniref:Uncharacterized protein n=1 Tax=Kitasatospora saccharophila TaxID=407973 RepID=A0ABP5JYM2_9ACTN